MPIALDTTRISTLNATYRLLHNNPRSQKLQIRKIATFWKHTLTGLADNTAAYKSCKVSQTAKSAHMPVEPAEHTTFSTIVELP